MSGFLSICLAGIKPQLMRVMQATHALLGSSRLEKAEQASRDTPLSALHCRRIRSKITRYFRYGPLKNYPLLSGEFRHAQGQCSKIARSLGGLGESLRHPRPQRAYEVRSKAGLQSWGWAVEVYLLPVDVYLYCMIDEVATTVLASQKIISTHAMLLLSIFPHRSGCSTPPTPFLRYAHSHLLLNRPACPSRNVSEIAAMYPSLPFSFSCRLGRLKHCLPTLQSKWVHRPDSQAPSNNCQLIFDDEYER